MCKSQHLAWYMQAKKRQERWKDKMRSRQQVHPDPESLITLPAEEEPSDPPAYPSATVDDTADQDRAISQDAACPASQTSQPRLLSSQQPPPQPLHQRQPLNGLIQETDRSQQSPQVNEPDVAGPAAGPAAVEDFIVSLEQSERHARQQMQHQARQKPKPQLQDVTVDHNRGQAAHGADTARAMSRQDGGTDGNRLVEPRVPVTGQELALVDDIDDAGDDMMEIESAEEGERERARLADRFLAVQVGSAVLTAPAVRVATSRCWLHAIRIRQQVSGPEISSKNPGILPFGLALSI